MAGILESLLSPEAAREIAARRDPNADLGANPYSLLLREAGRSAGMFRDQLGGALGTDMRSPEEQKRAKITSIMERAEGDTVNERMINSLPQLRDSGLLSPVQLAELEAAQQQAMQTQASGQALQGVAQSLVNREYNDLAALVATGEMTPAQALTEARLRDQNKGKGSGGGVSTAAVSGPMKDTYNATVAESEDLQGKLESMANREEPGFFGNLFGMEGDVKEGSVENLTQLASERAEGIFRENPRMGRPAAMSQAINEMYQAHSTVASQVEQADGQTTAVAPPPKFTAQQLMTLEEQLRSGQRVNIPGKGEYELINGKVTPVAEDDPRRGQVVTDVNPFAIPDR